jgi:hypothetical protein
MRETRLSLPELGLVAGTRAVLGVGLGLLLANRLSADQRKAVGWALFLVGAATTIPLALEVLGGGRMSAATGTPREMSGERRPESSDSPSREPAFAQI